MRLLLDTHALYWFLRGDETLSGRARRAIENAANLIYASAVSGYELAFKHMRGKLEFGSVEDLGDAIRRAGIREIAIELRHTVAAGELPGPHHDPWDRVLMAQAKLEGLIVVTRDRVFEEYGLRTLW